MPDPTPEDRREAEELYILAKGCMCCQGDCSLLKEQKEMDEDSVVAIATALAQRTEKVRQETMNMDTHHNNEIIAHNDRLWEAKLAEKEGVIKDLEDCAGIDQETITRLTAEVGRLREMLITVQDIGIDNDGAKTVEGLKHCIKRMVLEATEDSSSPPAEPGAGA